MTEIEEKLKVEDKVVKDLARFSKKIRTEYITTRDMETFINTIKGKIDVVVDVRWNTYYKSEQGFNPDSFKKALESNGIGYVYIKALGNPFHTLYDLKEFDMAKRDYLNYLKYNSKANKAFKELFSKFRFKKNYCLVCYCNTMDLLMCHRFWLKEALINYKRNILELSKDYALKKINSN